MPHRSHPLGVLMGCTFSILSSIATIGVTTLENIAIWERVVAGAIGIVASGVGLYVAIKALRRIK